MLPGAPIALAPPPVADGALLVVATALGLAALVGFVVWLRRRRLLRRVVRKVGPRAPRHPVVLAHGLLGFDAIQIGAARHEYFRGVPARLEAEGAIVHRARVAKTASIAARAEDLAAFVRSLPAKRVNVVAHSMGGLDARYAVAKLGLAGKVVSVTTVGTPHLGTPIADLGAGLPGRAPLLRALSRVGFEVDAFQDLTTARMGEFNRAVANVRGVAYGSVVGVAPTRRDVTPILLPTYLILGERDGGSDGLVPGASQRWGEVIRTISADHLAQIGWSSRFDAAEFYAELLRELRARGL